MHVVEQPGLADPLGRAPDFPGVEWAPRVKSDVAANDLVTRQEVALDVYQPDPVLLALVDLKQQINLRFVTPAQLRRVYSHVQVTHESVGILEHLQRLADLVTTVDIPGFDDHQCGDLVASKHP